MLVDKVSSQYSGNYVLFVVKETLSLSQTITILFVREKDCETPSFPHDIPLDFTVGLFSNVL